MINGHDLKGGIEAISEALKTMLPELKKQQDFLRAKMLKEMPEFVKDYDALMVDVWEGRKTAEDVAKFMQKYNHALRNKGGKNDLNNK